MKYHNIIRSLGDWDKLSADLDEMRDRAKDTELGLTIADESCPCCGFRPAIMLMEYKEKKQRQPKLI